MNLDVSLKPIKVINTFKVRNVFHNKEPLIILKYLDPKAKSLKTFSVTFLSKTQSFIWVPSSDPLKKKGTFPLEVEYVSQKLLICFHITPKCLTVLLLNK